MHVHVYMSTICSLNINAATRDSGMQECQLDNMYDRD